MRRRTVALIDDQPQQMKYFVLSLKERGFEVLLLDTVERAYEFFLGEHPALDAVILDLVMPPGPLPESDCRTAGVFLYDRLIGSQKIIAMGGRICLPTAVLTNTTNLEILRLMEQAAERHGGAVRIWRKLDTDPEIFADEFTAWLECPDVSGQGGGR